MNALLHSLARLHSGFLVLDPAHRVTHADARALQLLSRTRDELLGKSCWEILPREGAPPDRCSRPGSRVLWVRDPQGVDTWLLLRMFEIDDFLVVLLEDLLPVLAGSRKLPQLLRALENQAQPRQTSDYLHVLCCRCNKVRFEDGSWVSGRSLDESSYRNGLSHGYCPQCALDISKELDAQDKR
ncbi:MAG: PAS domain-containing protein [Pseudomonadota bacterium]